MQRKTILKFVLLFLLICLYGCGSYEDKENDKPEEKVSTGRHEYTSNDMLELVIDYKKGNFVLYDMKLDVYGTPIDVTIEDKDNKIFLNDKQNNKYVFEKTECGVRFLPEESASLDNVNKGWAIGHSGKIEFVEHELREFVYENETD